jgi:hypothetical protein
MERLIPALTFEEDVHAFCNLEVRLAIICYGG